MAVQLLGALAGGPAIPGELVGFGIVIIAIKPDLLTDASEFAREVAAYADSVRGARPIEGGPPVRMPFDDRGRSGAADSRKTRSRSRMRCMRGLLPSRSEPVRDSSPLYRRFPRLSSSRVHDVVSRLIVPVFA